VTAQKASNFLVAASVLAIFGSIYSVGQAKGTPAVDSTPKATSSTSESDLSKRMDSIEADLKKQEAESDFSLQLGIGSLVRNGNLTDYNNNSNTLSSTALGWATPQYLVGVSLRAPFPNFGRSGLNCKADAIASHPAERPAAVCPIWKQRPWGGFISLKFSSDASQTLNGYVLGGSYSLTPYLNVLVGFALTPVNVPSPGLRNAAANYVTQQQQSGNYLNFDPVAMRNNRQNAFDGFSLLDSTGKIIYQGSPLVTDYRGGVVIGIAIPLSFSDFLKKGK